MKKYIFLSLLFVPLFFVRCNEAGHPSHEDSVNANGNAHEQHQETTGSGLSLNDGKKWNADSSTVNHVRALQNIVDNSGIKPGATLAEYTGTGAELSAALDELISGCRMSGADHDALHLWLEPLHASIKQLSDATETASAEKEFENIRNQLNLFGEYFE